MIFIGIKQKFLLVFISISIIPVIIVTIISYNSYTNLVSKQISLISSNTISNSVDRMQTVLKDMDRITSIFVYQQYSPDNTIVEELKKYVSKDSNFTQYELLSTRKKLEFVCENLLVNYSYINGVYLFTTDGNCFNYSNDTNMRIDYIPSNDEWYNDTVQLEGKLYISDVSAKKFLINSKPSITFSRAFYDADYHKLLGVLMIDCDLDIFKDLNKVIVPNDTNIYLSNETGKILFDTSKTKIGESLPFDIFSETSNKSEGVIKDSKNSIITVFKSLPDYSWKIIALISADKLNKEFNTTQRLIVYISVICAVIFIFLSFIFSKLLTKPITELSELMHKNKSHKLVTTKKYLQRKDEISILYNEYNNMINEINTFIKESYQNRLITLDSQMKALEAQINSHFLFNTLESINSIAAIEEVESISIISKSLGDMFRYAIKTDSELVTLAQELAHVNNYLEIQKIRYGEKFDYSFDISEDLRNEKVLKLILQPLVENALYHGIENIKGKGELLIHAWFEDDIIVVEISDNGIGATPDQISELNKLLQKPAEIKDLGRRNKQSIGIKNIHSRIQLYYGNEYGLTIESHQNIGTKVRIHIPKL